MGDYSAQVPVADRWRIAAYIRALQLSQTATSADVPPGQPVMGHVPEPGGEVKAGATPARTTEAK